MTATERLAAALAERFDVLDAAAMARHPAFRKAAGAALDLLDEGAVIAQVVALGSLAGARDPYRVVVGRLRQVPTLLADRARIADELAEERRWAKVGGAARRGETLRGLVELGALFPDEARDAVRKEMDDDDLRAIALAALEGSKS